jgi:hypothetical protein
MKIYCLRIGNKYGPEYEDYINEKLKDYEVIWIREASSRSIPLQWNKLNCMNLDTNDPIIVLDIDIILTGNYKELFEYPIQRGEFVGIPHWWSDRYTDWKMNGGFQKYYPKDCKYIYDIFMENPKHWMMHYIRSQLTVGPVNGEQFFVEEHAKQRLDIKIVPESWVTRRSNDEEINPHIKTKYKEVNGLDLFESDEFNKDVKLVHFTTSLNKPHESHLWK